MNYESEKLSNWDKAIMDEIDDILHDNYEDYETGINLGDETKLDIAREFCAEFDFEDMRYFIMRKINKRLMAKLDYLRKKRQVCPLNKEEEEEFITLEMWESGAL